MSKCLAPGFEQKGWQGGLMVHKFAHGTLLTRWISWHIRQLDWDEDDAVSTKLWRYILLALSAISKATQDRSDQLREWPSEEDDSWQAFSTPSRMPPIPLKNSIK